MENPPVVLMDSLSHGRVSIVLLSTLSSTNSALTALRSNQPHRLLLGAATAARNESTGDSGAITSVPHRHIKVMFMMASLHQALMGMVVLRANKCRHG